MLSESHKSGNARLNTLLKVIRKTIISIHKIKTLLATKLKTKHNFSGPQKKKSTQSKAMKNQNMNQTVKKNKQKIC